MNNNKDKTLIEKYESDSKTKLKVNSTKIDLLSTLLLKLGVKEQSPIFAVKNWITTIAYAFILALVFKTFFYENFKIPSGSMNPLLLNGDRVLVNKFYYGYSKFSFPLGLAPIKDRILSNRTPKRGDIVVFKNKLKEDGKNIFYIKRVIGLPGDTIQLKDNKLYINDEQLQYKKLDILNGKTKYNHNSFPSIRFIEKNTDNKVYDVLISDVDSIAGNTKIYKVPKGHYFCMGDNRDNSKDSRFSDFGTIPFRNIVGRAEKIFFSTANGSINLDRIFKSIIAQEIDVLN